MRLALVIVGLVLIFATRSASAQGKAVAEKPSTPAKLENRIEIEDQPVASEASVTQHSATIGGEELQYTATAGTLPLQSDDGKTTAEVFYVAYTRDGVDDKAARPVTFCFNGGPGSSSVWLHMGMLAPKRVFIPDDARPQPPPGRLVENHHSLLDVTDLVFIDPVSTGYSRPAKGEEKKQFHGYEEDLRSVGQFVHLYLTRNGRWLSPKFLCGESYGTLRAAGLAEYLQDRYYLELNGIVLVSSVLDFQTIRFGKNNDLPYIAFLPGYAATAWYHRQLDEDLQKQPLEKFLAEVEQFTLEEYAPALLKGSALPRKRAREVAEKVARYTGLSARFVRRSNLRVSMSRFGKELLRGDRRTVGRFDSRFVGIDRDAAGDSPDYDPSGAAIFGPFTAAIYHYLRTELGVRRDIPYEILTDAVHPWSFDEFENRYVDAAPELRDAMTRNPFLKVFVANGYYDLATPYFGTEHTFRHLMLDQSLQDNITMGYYEAGHMMYVHEPSLKQLKADLVKFYANALPTAEP